MPYAPKRPCSTCRTGFATYRGRCATCATTQRIARADTTGDAFYASRTWRKYRTWFLAGHPLCVAPECQAYPHAANEVDHIVPRRERPDLAFVESNCRALCKAAHSRITAITQSGWRER